MTVTEAHPNRHALSQEDVQRINRLSEEVRSRLREIALITARTVGDGPPKGHVLKYVPREAEPTRQVNAGAGDWVEIEEVDGVEVCYGVIDGVPFAESPCGAGG